MAAADQINSYIAGLILLAAAPCTAMVFVWSNLMKGEPHFTLSQVALNDTIMVFAFAPIVGLLLGLSAITVPWDTLVLSVVLYIVIPVIVAQADRRQRPGERRRGGAVPACLTDLVRSRWSPCSRRSFSCSGSRASRLSRSPLVIALLAVPILIQVYFNAGVAYLLNRLAGEQHCVAGPSALIGASNFFELAVAAAISLFGFNSGAALATVVGVLIEVPVMLSAVWIVNNSRDWYERRPARRARALAAMRAAHHDDASASPDDDRSAMTVTIYHNPNCGTSRNVLAMIRQSGEEPVVIEYLKTPPTRERLKELIARDGNSGPRAPAREGNALRRTRPRRSEMDRRPTDRLHDGAPDPDQPADRRHAERASSSAVRRRRCSTSCRTPTSAGSSRKTARSSTLVRARGSE